ncbi:hypothetical protein NUU61_000151 [Penicillium alfredii]|uniref:DUF202 domain-containing protein n=1 Tax=Penicillium alfredii TaxID=1506179 RepID=A0A9W9KQM6_9EURO|nr:uncharacterized protein NUU61_000151 [Penicillium alfredii]KAJ5114392.1 hypothetical protein NUU61_000151 [Penicillium alfredii]
MPYTGHCNCESIRITLPQQPPSSVVCHCAVWTATPMTPGKVFLKATLFDSISPSGSEVFGEKRLPWVNIEQQSHDSDARRPVAPSPTMTDPPGQPSEPGRPSTAVVRESRPTPARDNNPDEREALELHEIQTREDNELDLSTPSASSGEEYRITTRRTTSRAGHRRAREDRKGPWNRICRFWTHQVSLIVPHKNNRDHLGENISTAVMPGLIVPFLPRSLLAVILGSGLQKAVDPLERTFLAYIRTSVVIAMQGVLIAQLFRLQRSESEADRLRFHDVGIPLSVACHCVAVLIAFIGSYRFWKQQGAISVGKVYAGGWDINSVGILLFAVILTTLILSIAIMVEIDLNPSKVLRRILRR